MENIDYFTGTPRDPEDPSIGRFKFSASEREEYLKKGMTHEEIKQKEDEVTNRLAAKQLEKESENSQIH